MKHRALTQVTVSAPCIVAKPVLRPASLFLCSPLRNSLLIRIYEASFFESNLLALDKHGDTPRTCAVCYIFLRVKAERKIADYNSNVSSALSASLSDNFHFICSAFYARFHEEFTHFFCLSSPCFVILSFDCYQLVNIQTNIRTILFRLSKCSEWIHYAWARGWKRMR